MASIFRICGGGGGGGGGGGCRGGGECSKQTAVIARIFDSLLFQANRNSGSMV